MQNDYLSSANFRKLLAYLFIFACGFVALTFAAGSRGVSPQHVTKTAGAPVRTLRILFIGNSYTSVNDLPKMLADVASSDPSNTTQFVTQAVTRDGARLSELWSEGKALSVLQAGPWDYVVLQEQSLWVFSPESVQETGVATAIWNEAIKKAGARTVLFTTWARYPVKPWYIGPDYAALKDPATMTGLLDTQTNALANRLRITAIPVGDAWARTTRALGAPVLYDADGSHPSMTGTWFTALIFYKFFTQRSPNQVALLPNGLDVRSAAILKALASN